MRKRLAALHEHHIYFLLLALSAIAYLLGSWSAPTYALGWSQLRHLGLPRTVLAYALIVVAIGASLRLEKSSRVRQFLNRLRSLSPVWTWSATAIFAALCILCFWSLRSGFINPDGYAFTEKFPRDIPSLGAHVTHDEIWELYIHSRFWDYTSRRLGWSVIKSYQVLSVLGGGAFVFVLLALCRTLLPRRGIELALLAACGAYMQLFFGDAENYTLTSVILIAYLLCAYLTLEGRLPLVVPSTVLAVGITFHVVSAGFGLSLVYLYLQALLKRRYRQVVWGAVSFVLVIAVTLVFMNFHGLPLRIMTRRSHIFGRGGRWNEYIAPPSLAHYLEMADLLLLLYPPLVLFLPLLGFRRIERSPVNVMLSLCAVPLMLFTFVWIPWLGAYYDWNLYAPVAIPLGLLFGYNFLRIQGLRYKVQIFVSTALLTGLASYAWIVANHMGLRR